MTVKRGWRLRAVVVACLLVALRSPLVERRSIASTCNKVASPTRGRIYLVTCCRTTVICRGSWSLAGWRLWFVWHGHQSVLRELIFLSPPQRQVTIGQSLIDANLNIPVNVRCNSLASTIPSGIWWRINWVIYRSEYSLWELFGNSCTSSFDWSISGLICIQGSDGFNWTFYGLLNYRYTTKKQDIDPSIDLNSQEVGSTVLMFLW